MSDQTQTGPADRLAFWISAGCSPFVVLPAFLILLMVVRAAGIPHVLAWTAFALFGLVGIPVSYIVYEVRRGAITDVHVRELEQRRGPFNVALGSTFGTLLVLLLAKGPVELQLVAATVAVNGILCAAISRRWKISMHPSVYVSAVVVTALLVDPRWWWALWLTPLLIWARVRRHRHSWAQGVVATLLAGSCSAALVGLCLGRLPAAWIAR